MITSPASYSDVSFPLLIVISFLQCLPCVGEISPKTSPIWNGTWQTILWLVLQARRKGKYLQYFEIDFARLAGLLLVSWIRKFAWCWYPCIVNICFLFVGVMARRGSNWRIIGNRVWEKGHHYNAIMRVVPGRFRGRVFPFCTQQSCLGFCSLGDHNIICARYLGSFSSSKPLSPSGV